MNSTERVENAVNLKPTDRIPVSPLIIGYAAVCAGKTQKQIYGDVGSWIDSLEAAYRIIGDCDTVFSRWPYDVARMQMMEYRFPGRELDENSPAQAIEKELMQRRGYDDILSGGYTRWFFNHMAGIWGIRTPFPLSMPRIIPNLLGLNLRTARIMRPWAKQGVPANFDSACYPPFDLFSLVRSGQPFFYDLADIPEKVELAMRSSVKDIAKMARAPLRFGGGNKICIYPMRSSASFISPAMFERFSFPYLKELVEGFWKDGLVSVLHCDGNWTPMLRYLATLPPKSCIVELDGDTDIFQAKALLGGRLCLKGNVPASLLAFGTRDQILAYCCRLNHEIGADGGFILSSGCEVPLNAKLENVKAIVDSVSI